MKYTHKFSLFGKTLMIKLQVIDKPIFRTEGICSRIPNSYFHVLFLDYDIIEENTLIDELKALQEAYDLSEFYVFETRKNGYHAICLDCSTLYQTNQIILSSSADLAFKLAPRFCEYRTWVLRSHEKGERDRPKFAFTVQSKFADPDRIQSNAHAQYLMKHYGIPVKLHNSDKQFHLNGIKYLTANRCKKE